MGERTVGSLHHAMTAMLTPPFGDEAHAEARELLAALHDMPRHWPTVDRAAPIDDDAWYRGLDAAAARVSGEPLQYAAGRASFRHLTLDVDPRVLIPRPETELLVDLVLDAVRATPGGMAVDVGTGSGAIALALASEGRFDRVIGTDVSRDAIDVARRNAERCASVLRTPIEMRHGSLLAPVRERGLAVVVSNPPYIAFEEAAELPAAVRDWEPSIALFSSSDGMATTALLITEAADALATGGLLALEVDVRRAAVVAALAASHGAYGDVQVKLDLTGRERFVVARRLED